jgi:DNA repair exonuclease SbcCD nuclease subunit
MAAKTLAHLSDLHLGRSAATEAAARQLCANLLAGGVDHLVVTGDITHRGRCRDLELFFRIFEPFERSGRLTVVPGNHDRNGEDCGAELMGGCRVAVVERPGLHLVQVDTTAAHNRSVIASHGELSLEVARHVDRAVRAARPGALVAVLMHHHLVPLPVESIGEWFADQVGWPHAEELSAGKQLIWRLRGYCDLILHGHRHTPTVIPIEEFAGRDLTIYNAGSSTELGRARVFIHSEGRLLAAPIWMPAQLERVPRLVTTDSALLPDPSRSVAP